jgi:uncharacterized membrane protein YfcA
MDLAGALLLAVSSAVAGAINSVAGGGSLVTFPAAILAGLSPLVANATNSVALAPGSLSSAWAYRRELARDREVVVSLLPATLLGGLLGSGLLLATPQRVFDAVVPLLVLLAVALLVWQNLRPRAASGPDDATAPWRLPERRFGAWGVQLAIGVYGGYFGAGMGIMMLALFGLLGGRDLHRMNAVKSILAVGINGFASIVFVAAGAVDGPAAAVMMVGAIAGGFLGAAFARKVDPRRVRWLVVALGVVIAAELARRRWLA